MFNIAALMIRLLNEKHCKNSVSEHKGWKDQQYNFCTSYVIMKTENKDKEKHEEKMFQLLREVQTPPRSLPLCHLNSPTRCHMLYKAWQTTIDLSQLREMGKVLNIWHHFTSEEAGGMLWDRSAIGDLRDDKHTVHTSRHSIKYSAGVHGRWDVCLGARCCSWLFSSSSRQLRGRRRECNLHSHNACSTEHSPG